MLRVDNKKTDEHPVSDKRFEAPFLRKLSTAVSLVGSSLPVFVIAFAATLFELLLARCQPPLF